jgi:TPR repeat protein
MVPRALRRILLLLVVGSAFVVRATPLVAAGADASSQVPALGQSAGRSAGARAREAETPGDPVACYREGTAYANGAGVARDEARAAALFQRACDGGVMSGCANLGWFNAALIAAELQDYPTAVDYMNRYLELMPDAPDARNARDQVTIWEEKAAR